MFQVRHAPSMKSLVGSLILLSCIASVQAKAEGSHHGHYDFGEPGQADAVTRTVKMEAVDANGEMRFKHAPRSITLGETIRFVVTNKGQVPHEFIIGDAASQRAHAAMMREMPDMEHEDDASAITLQPGETKELIWHFSKPVHGDIELACQIPGHYEAGMVSKVPLIQ
ncbi:cupredoxin family protein [Dongia soli]|uniref:Cupredoxin family protein n=1 Tax=Dongia soli TaxID=600628 RepID=A0ABU5EC03_9PROT|nr:cupredoxin family protein [Dongia soli]MDY0883530.1 cupredoxin family protein [Dongia soli]